jgi:hypothetical protein
MLRTVRKSVAPALLAVAVSVGMAAPTFAQGNNNGSQTGLINVNASNIVANIPVSVALPIGLAANLCGINAGVLAAAQQNNSSFTCTATSNPSATSVAQALSTGAAGTGNNNGTQTGLVNVNISNILLNVPISAAVPVGVAANACGINAAVLLALAQQNGSTYSCTATSMPMALAGALAGA